MALRFCANLNFMFCENASANILDKFRLARAAGFRGVEIGCPDTLDVESVVNEQRNNELDIVLINISLGNLLSFKIGTLHCARTHSNRTNWMSRFISVHSIQWRQSKRASERETYISVVLFNVHCLCTVYEFKNSVVGNALISIHSRLTHTKWIAQVERRWWRSSSSTALVVVWAGNRWMESYRYLAVNELIARTLWNFVDDFEWEIFERFYELNAVLDRRSQLNEFSRHWDIFNEFHSMFKLFLEWKKFVFPHQLFDKLRVNRVLFSFFRVIENGEWFDFHATHSICTSSTNILGGFIQFKCVCLQVNRRAEELNLDAVRYRTLKMSFRRISKERWNTRRLWIARSECWNGHLLIEFLSVIFILVPTWQIQDPYYGW